MNHIGVARLRKNASKPVIAGQARRADMVDSDGVGADEPLASKHRMR
jgi:hypothetical protein